MTSAKYLWGVLLVALFAATTAETRRVIVPKAADGGDDAPAALSQRAVDDDDQAPQFKPVLIARRPLRPSSSDAERQPVVVIRQSPARALNPRLRADVPAEDDDQDLAPQQPQDSVVIRQQPARPRAQQPSAQQQQQLSQQRFKEPSQQQQQQQQQQKEPTAQTIRNYNKLNDDGSFTFGYEADDGSFKEETRGTDCVVRGKYGYVDPDGNKREFSYVQGNPCDPNAPAEEDDDQQQRQPGGGRPDEEENVPANANVPRPRPAAAPKKNRPATTLFQQTFGDFEQQPEQPQPSAGPRQPGRQELPRRPPQISSPLQQQQQQQADGVRLTSAAAQPSPAPSFRPSIAAADDLESAIRNLPQPSPVATASGKPLPAGPNSPLYTTELVFDPATGQYNTVVFQQVPRQSAGISINQRLPLAPARQPQPLAPARQPQPQFQPHSPPQFQQPQPQPQFRPAPQPFQQPQFQPQRPAEFDFQRPAGFAPAPPPAGPPQQQFLQQQQAFAFQQSQNLFRQQQQKQQQQPQPFQPQSSQFFPPPSQRFVGGEQPQFAPPKQQRFDPQTDAANQQQFVLVQPGRTPSQQNLAAGQIDAFLRGHNVQF